MEIRRNRITKIPLSRYALQDPEMAETNPGTCICIQSSPNNTFAVNFYPADSYLIIETLLCSWAFLFESRKLLLFLYDTYQFEVDLEAWNAFVKEGMKTLQPNEQIDLALMAPSGNPIGFLLDEVSSQNKSPPMMMHLIEIFDCMRKTRLVNSDDSELFITQLTNLTRNEANKTEDALIQKVVVEYLSSPRCFLIESDTTNPLQESQSAEENMLMTESVVTNQLSATYLEQGTFERNYFPKGYLNRVIEFKDSASHVPVPNQKDMYFEDTVPVPHLERSYDGHPTAVDTKACLELLNRLLERLEQGRGKDKWSPNYFRMNELSYRITSEKQLMTKLATMQPEQQLDVFMRSKRELIDKILKPDCSKPQSAPCDDLFCPKCNKAEWVPDTRAWLFFKSHCFVYSSSKPRPKAEDLIYDYPRLHSLTKKVINLYIEKFAAMYSWDMPLGRKLKKILSSLLVQLKNTTWHNAYSLAVLVNVKYDHLVQAATAVMKEGKEVDANAIVSGFILTMRPYFQSAEAHFASVMQISSQLLQNEIFAPTSSNFRNFCDMLQAYATEVFPKPEDMCIAILEFISGTKMMGKKFLDKLIEWILQALTQAQPKKELEFWRKALLAIKNLFTSHGQFYSNFVPKLRDFFMNHLLADTEDVMTSLLFKDRTGMFAEVLKFTFNHKSDFEKVNEKFTSDAGSYLKNILELKTSVWVTRVLLFHRTDAPQRIKEVAKQFSFRGFNEIQKNVENYLPELLKNFEGEVSLAKQTGVTLRFMASDPICSSMDLTDVEKLDYDFRHLEQVSIERLEEANQFASTMDMMRLLQQLKESAVYRNKLEHLISSECPGAKPHPIVFNRLVRVAYEDFKVHLRSWLNEISTSDFSILSQDQKLLVDAKYLAAIEAGISAEEIRRLSTNISIFKVWARWPKIKKTLLDFGSFLSKNSKLRTSEVELVDGFEEESPLQKIDKQVEEFMESKKLAFNSFSNYYRSETRPLVFGCLVFISSDLDYFSIFSRCLELLDHFKDKSTKHFNELSLNLDQADSSIQGQQIGIIQELAKIYQSNQQFNNIEDFLRKVYACLKENLKVDQSMLAQMVRRTPEITLYSRHVSRDASDVMQRAGEVLLHGVIQFHILKPKKQVKFHAVIERVRTSNPEEIMADKSEMSLVMIEDEVVLPKIEVSGYELKNVKVKLQAFLRSIESLSLVDDYEDRKLVATTYTKTIGIIEESCELLRKLTEAGWLSQFLRTVNAKEEASRVSVESHDLEGSLVVKLRIAEARETLAFDTSLLKQLFDDLIAAYRLLEDKRNNPTSEDHLLHCLQADQKAFIQDFIDQQCPAKDLPHLLNITRFITGKQLADKFAENLSNKLHSVDRNTSLLKFLALLNSLACKRDQLAIEDCDQIVSSIPKDKDKFAYYVYKDKTKVYEELFEILAFSGDDKFHPLQIFQANKYTKAQELQSFILRALTDSQMKCYFLTDAHLLSERISSALITYCRQYLDKKNPDYNTNLIIVMSNDTACSFIASEIKKLCSYFQLLACEDVDPQHVKNIIESAKGRMKLTVVQSECAGMGKTFYVQQAAKNEKSELRPILLSGIITPETIADRLKLYEAEAKPRSSNAAGLSLHFKVDMMEDLENSFNLVDQLFFQIAYLNCYPYRQSLLFFDDLKHVYIEIGNSSAESVAANCRFLSFLHDQTVSIRAFSSPEDLGERFDPAALEDLGEMADTFRLLMSKYNSSKLPPNFSAGQRSEEFQNNSKLENKHHLGQSLFDAIRVSLRDRADRLREEYSEDDGSGAGDGSGADYEFRFELGNFSFAQIVAYLKIMHHQLTEMDKIPSLNETTLQRVTDNIEYREIRKLVSSTRLEIVRMILDLAANLTKGFASAVREETKEALTIAKASLSETDQTKGLAEYKRKMLAVPKWDLTSNTSIYFYNETMKVIYSDPAEIDQNLADYMQISDNLRPLPNFQELDQHERQAQLTVELVQALELVKTTKFDLINPDRFFTQEQICEHLLRKFELFRDKGYILTADNYIKILVIFQRAALNIPVIIMGATGCGKTYMIEFIASCLLQESFECFTLHPGVTEDDIKNEILKVHSKAVANQNKRYWVLFDEFNTSPLQGIISEIVCDRKSSFCLELSGLCFPPNLKFVAACNPYRIEPNISAAGLTHDLGTTILAHRVFPIPDSLVNYVWDFGQISGDYELEYIRSMIEKEVWFAPTSETHEGPSSNTNFVERVAQVISVCQTFVREQGSDNSVSLRDVSRFRTILAHFIGIFENDPVDAIVCTVNLCYLFRLDSEEHKRQLSQEIDRILGGGVDSQSRFRAVLDSFEQDLLALEVVPRGINLNKPLKENLFALVACMVLKIPIIICGKPGTSKTLAIRIAQEIFNKHVPIQGKPSFFGSVGSMVYINFWGSLNTTSQSLLEVFDKAEKFASQKPELQSLKKRVAIIFDEIGLAEIAPENPLKVLHPLLEPKERLFSFVGLSNWRLDQSKMNRVIYVSRPDLEAEDLKTLYDVTHLKNKKLVKRRLDYFADTYAEYIREQQQENVSSHRNFHGSRDFYEAVKLILKMAKDIEEDHPGAVSLKEDYSFESLLQTAVELAIHRCFAGKRVLGESTAHRFLKNYQRKLRSSSVKQSEGLSIPSSIDMIYMSLLDTNNRHMMIFTESATTEEIIVQQIIEFEQNVHKKKPYMIEKLYGSPDNSEQFEKEVISKLPVYIKNGYTVIMKDLPKVYGCLYDLLNLNYSVTQLDGEKECDLTFDDRKESVRVNERFKCIVLMQREDTITHRNQLEKTQPAPFLNRFEKFLLLEEDFIPESKKHLMAELEKKYLSSEGQSKIPYQYLIHNLSKEVLFSLMVENRGQIAEKLRFKHSDSVDIWHGVSAMLRGKQCNEQPIDEDLFVDADCEKMLERLWSRNMLVMETLNDKGVLPKEIASSFLSNHPYDSLRDCLRDFADGKSKKSKGIVFTFSSSWEVDEVVEKCDVEGIVLYEATQYRTKDEEFWDERFQDESKTVHVIQFRSRKDWRLIKGFKHLVESCLHPFVPVLFVAHTTIEDLRQNCLQDSSINLFAESWDMVVIDKVAGCNYAGFIDSLGKTVGDWVKNNGQSDGFQLQAKKTAIKQFLDAENPNEEKLVKQQAAQTLVDFCSIQRVSKSFDLSLSKTSLFKQKVVELFRNESSSTLFRKFVDYQDLLTEKVDTVLREVVTKDMKILFSKVPFELIGCINLLDQSAQKVLINQLPDLLNPPSKQTNPFQDLNALDRTESAGDLLKKGSAFAVKFEEFNKQFMPLLKKSKLVVGASNQSELADAIIAIRAHINKLLTSTAVIGNSFDCEYLEVAQVVAGKILIEYVKGFKQDLLNSSTLGLVSKMTVSFWKDRNPCTIVSALTLTGLCLAVLFEKKLILLQRYCKSATPEKKAKALESVLECFSETTNLSLAEYANKFAKLKIFYNREQIQNQIDDLKFALELQVCGIEQERNERSQQPRLAGTKLLLSLLLLISPLPEDLFKTCCNISRDLEKETRFEVYSLRFISKFGQAHLAEARKLHEGCQDLVFDCMLGDEVEHGDKVGYLQLLGLLIDQESVGHILKKKRRKSNLLHFGAKVLAHLTQTQASSSKLVFGQSQLRELVGALEQAIRKNTSQDEEVLLDTFLDLNSMLVDARAKLQTPKDRQTALTEDQWGRLMSLLEDYFKQPVGIYPLELVSLLLKLRSFFEQLGAQKNPQTARQEELVLKILEENLKVRLEEKNKDKQRKSVGLLFVRQLYKYFPSSSKFREVGLTSAAEFVDKWSKEIEPDFKQTDPIMIEVIESYKLKPRLLEGWVARPPAEKLAAVEQTDPLQTPISLIHVYPVYQNLFNAFLDPEISKEQFDRIELYFQTHQPPIAKLIRLHEELILTQKPNLNNSPLKVFYMIASFMALASSLPPQSPYCLAALSKADLDSFKPLLNYPSPELERELPILSLYEADPFVVLYSCSNCKCFVPVGDCGNIATPGERVSADGTVDYGRSKCMNCQVEIGTRENDKPWLSVRFPRLIQNQNQNSNLIRLNTVEVVQSISNRLKDDDAKFRHLPPHKLDETSWIADKYVELDGRPPICALLLKMIDLMIRFTIEFCAESKEPITEPAPETEAKPSPEALQQAIATTFESISTEFEKDAHSTFILLNAMFSDFYLEYSTFERLSWRQKMRELICDVAETIGQERSNILQKYYQDCAQLNNCGESTKLKFLSIIRGDMPILETKKYCSANWTSVAFCLTKTPNLEPIEVLENLEARRKRKPETDKHRDFVIELWAEYSILSEIKSILHNLHTWISFAHGKLEGNLGKKAANQQSIKETIHQDTASKRTAGKSNPFDTITLTNPKASAAHESLFDQKYREFCLFWSETLVPFMNRCARHLELKLECQEVNLLLDSLHCLLDPSAPTIRFLVTDLEPGGTQDAQDQILRVVTESLLDYQNRFIEKHHKMRSDIAEPQQPQPFLKTKPDQYLSFGSHDFKRDLVVHSYYEYSNMDRGKLITDTKYLSSKYAEILLAQVAPLSFEVRFGFAEVILLNIRHKIATLLKKLGVDIRNAELSPICENFFVELQNNDKLNQFLVELSQHMPKIISELEHFSNLQGATELAEVCREIEFQSLENVEDLEKIKVCDLELVRRRIQLEKYKDRLTEWEVYQPDYKSTRTDPVPLYDNIRTNMKNKENKSKIIELLKIQFVDTFTSKDDFTQDKLQSTLKDMCDYNELDELFESIDNETELAKLHFRHLPALIKSLESEQD